MSISHWENSDGRIAGCLPRASKPGELCPLFSERIKVIPRREWSDILEDPNHMDLWPSVPVVLDQNGLGCHDDQTEVLTETGWQRWPEYDRKTALGTINPQTHALEFQLPSAVQAYEYDGLLHHVEHRSMSLAVTPNHRMYVRKWNERDRKLNDHYEIRDMGHVGWYSGMLAAPSGFVGTGLDEISIGHHQYSGDDFLALVSLVASDGWVGGADSTWHRVSFCCFREDRIDMVRKLAKHLGFREQSNRPGVWEQRNPALADWFRANLFTGTELRSPYKRVPAIVKCASARQAKLFLQFYGDQHIDKKSRRSFYTSSEQMADDLQEMLLRIGKRSGICEHKPRDTTMKDGRQIKAENCHTPYTVSEWTSDKLSIEGKKIEKEEYKGTVFCATVPNSLLVTRRNKKVLISGNSCATESTTGGVMLMRSFNGQSFELLNPWFVYHTTSGGRDSGSNIDSNLAFVREHGIAPESVWPRSKGFRATPSAEAKEKALSYRIVEFFDISNEEEFGSALLQGFAVVYGRSGHSILAISLVDDANVRMLNSWGDWGDRGTQVERLSGVRWSYGAFGIRFVTDTRQPLIVPASELVIPRFEPCPEIIED